MTPDRPDLPDVHPWVREAQQQPRFAIVGTFLPEWAQVRDFAVRAEELGFDAYWANDHPLRSMDCWTTLAALATVTTRLRLIALVSCVYYRSPALIARQAADVDRISGGRLVLGLGTGDDAAEFGQLGLRFPAAPERLAALAEAAGIIRGLWAGPVTHEGPHFQVREAHVRPGPVQQPRVPVLIGGGGERTTLRLVAKYADVSNFGPHEWTGGAYDLAAVRRKYEVLRGYCQEIGRPYDAILRTHYTPLLTLAETPRELESKRSRARIPDAGLRTVPVFATADEAIVHYQGLIDAGVQYFLATVNGRDTQTAELLAGQVMPALRPAERNLSGPVAAIELVDPGGVRADRLDGHGGFAGPQDAQQPPVPVVPPGGELVVLRTELNQVQVDLGTQSRPGPADPFVVAGLEDGVVKFNVERGDRLPGQRARQIAEPGQHLLDPVEIGARRQPAEPLDGEFLQGGAQAVDLIGIIAGQGGHRGPAVPVDDDQAFLAQPGQRLPHRAAADGELGGQLMLDQPLPGLEAAGHDGLAQGVRDLIGQDPAGGRTQRRPLSADAHRRPHPPHSRINSGRQSITVDRHHQATSCPSGPPAYQQYLRTAGPASRRPRRAGHRSGTTTRATRGRPRPGRPRPAGRTGRWPRSRGPR